MPIADEASTAERGALTVTPSVATEMFWALHSVLKGKAYRRLPALVSPPVEVAAAVRSIWDGELDCFGELLVFADAAGCLTAADPARVLAALRSPAGVRRDLPLRSETESDRRRLLERVGRLLDDARLRARYVDTVEAVWRLVAPDWEREGQETAARAAARFRQRVDAGARFADLLPSGCFKSEPWASQTAVAAAQGRLVLVPGYLSGRFLAWDLEHAYLVGFPAEPDDELAAVRRRAQQLAGRLKVLADPTRLALLTWLAERPSTVTDLAREFDIAQPTVSTHLRLLRDAGLVEAGREDGRTLQVVDRAALATLIAEAGTSLLGDRS